MKNWTKEHDRWSRKLTPTATAAVVIAQGKAVGVNRYVPCIFIDGMVIQQSLPFCDSVSAAKRTVMKMAKRITKLQIVKEGAKK